MPGVNRHRPPSIHQLVMRIYRKQVASEKLIRELKEQVSTRTQINATLAEHCRRLLREKATMLEVIEANQFMAAALPRRTA